VEDTSLHQFLVLYAWFPLAVLLSFMLLIGRFYQKLSGETTFYRLYFLAIIVFAALFVRIAGSGIIIGDFVADALSIIAGGLLLFLSLVLYLRMMTNKDQKS